MQLHAIDEYMRNWENVSNFHTSSEAVPKGPSISSIGLPLGAECIFYCTTPCTTL